MATSYAFSPHRSRIRVNSSAVTHRLRFPAIPAVPVYSLRPPWSLCDQSLDESHAPRLPRERYLPCATIACTRVQKESWAVSQTRLSQDDFPRVRSPATRGLAIRKHVQQMNILRQRGFAITRRVFGITEARNLPPELNYLVISAAPFSKEVSRAVGKSLTDARHMFHSLASQDGRLPVQTYNLTVAACSCLEVARAEVPWRTNRHACEGRFSQRGI